MSFRQNYDGKNVFFAVDSRSIPSNPLYNIFKAKSFTTNDITLHFCILDMLVDFDGLSAGDIAEKFSDAYFSAFDNSTYPDLSTIRKKLKEYEKLGILKSRKQGNQVLYSRNESDVPLDKWSDAIKFFSEVSPLGMVGSYLLDKQNDRENFFNFKHHYMLHTLESEVLYSLLCAIKDELIVNLEIVSLRSQKISVHKAVPLQIRISTRSGRRDIDFEKLDNTIIEYVPSGKNTHEGRIVRFPQLQDLHFYRSRKDTKRLERSIGSLGGGNHFIEVDVDDDNCKYLVIHTGSRNLGTQVALLYQNMAYDILCGKDKLFETQKKLIEDYKAQGRRSEIQNAITELKRNFKAKTSEVPKERCYLTGEYRQQYLDDMRICQQFALLNREIIANIIIEKMFGKSLSDYEHFQIIYNYIDLESNIVRKGAVSAKSGEKLLILLNMRDGNLICTGKGNEDWNCSAPHGAGRLMSRSSAFESLSLDEFQKQMQGIYSTSVTGRTLDESPMTYKNKDEIVSNISPTAEITKTVKPVYNFKSLE